MCRSGMHLLSESACTIKYLGRLSSSRIYTATAHIAAMAMLVDYGSSDDEAGPSSAAPPTALPGSRIIAAPDVSLEVS